MQKWNKHNLQSKSMPIVDGLGRAVLEHAYLPSSRRDACAIDEPGFATTFANLMGGASRHLRLRGADPG